MNVYGLMRLLDVLPEETTRVYPLPALTNGELIKYLQKVQRLLSKFPGAIITQADGNLSVTIPLTRFHPVDVEWLDQPFEIARRITHTAAGLSEGHYDQVKLDFEPVETQQQDIEHICRVRQKLKPHFGLEFYGQIVVIIWRNKQGIATPKP